MGRLIGRLLANVYVLLTPRLGFDQVSAHLSRIPFRLGYRIRYAYYKKTLNSVGDNVTFSWGAVFTQQDIAIGDNVRFGPMNTIGLVDFGDNILIGQSVHFLSGSRQHGAEMGQLITDQPGVITRVHVASDIWVGAGAIVLADIAKGCIVAAGAVVTKPTSEYTIVGGVPAKTIGRR